MSDEFLSQEEIDTLLGGDEAGETGAPEDGNETPFDFSELENIRKGGLPGLELIFERWVKYFRDEVRTIVPHVNMVNKENIYITRFSAFMGKISQPSSYTGLVLRPLKEQGMFVLDSRMVFAIISVLFGGEAKPFKVEGREFTKLEMQVITNFITIVVDSFEEVWRPIYEVNIERKSTELNPVFAQIVSPNEKVAIVECSMNIDDYEAPMYFCFPLSMFTPIREIIYSELSAETGEEWEQELQRRLMKLKIPLTLEVVRKHYMVKEILEWERGDELMLNVSKTSDLFLRVGGKRKFTCQLGKANDHYAAMVKTSINESDHE